MWIQLTDGATLFFENENTKLLWQNFKNKKDFLLYDFCGFLT